MMRSGVRDNVIGPELDEIARDLEVDKCAEGVTEAGWPYHAHLVIGAIEIQLYRDSGNLARGDAGDIMFTRRDGEYWEMELR